MTIVLADVQTALSWLMQGHRVIDAISLALGLWYLYLEYKASIWLWLVSIVMPIVHSVNYFEAGLYADFGMEFFYVVVAVYGYLSWRLGKRRGGGKGEAPVTRFPRRMVLPAAGALVVLWGALYLFLRHFTPSTVPVADAFTTALSIVAYWALARKWAEQWLLWLVVDAVSTCLYVYKDIPFTAVLYAFYTAIAVLGYRKWLRLIPPAAAQEEGA